MPTLVQMQYNEKPIHRRGSVKGQWLLLIVHIYMWLCIYYITRELAMAGAGPSSYADITYTVFHYLLYTAGR